MLILLKILTTASFIFLVIWIFLNILAAVFLSGYEQGMKKAEEIAEEVFNSIEEEFYRRGK